MAVTNSFLRGIVVSAMNPENIGEVTIAVAEILAILAQPVGAIRDHRAVPALLAPAPAEIGRRRAAPGTPSRSPGVTPNLHGQSMLRWGYCSLLVKGMVADHRHCPAHS